MDADETMKGVRLLKEALEVLSRGPFDYTLKCLIAAHETLLTRYAPFKVGDRVTLAVTPTINEKTSYGWLGSKHFLKAGAAGVVRSSDVRSDGALAFSVEFDEETWLDRDGVEHPIDRKHTYCFGEKSLALLVTPNVLGVTRQTLQAFDFPNGMTVAELKAMVRDWPETDEYGEPCEVWLCDSRGLSNQARMATPLNKRQSEDGTKQWADFMLGHDA